MQSLWPYFVVVSYKFRMFNPQNSFVLRNQPRCVQSMGIVDGDVMLSNMFCYKVILSPNIFTLVGIFQILQCSWHSKLPLVVKVFIWRVLIGELPLGLALKHCGLATGNYFFLHCSNGRQYSSIYTMSDCLSHLELHFSNLASFITMLFDTQTMGVCTMYTS